MTGAAKSCLQDRYSMSDPEPSYVRTSSMTCAFIGKPEAGTRSGTVCTSGLDIGEVGDPPKTSSGPKDSCWDSSLSLGEDVNMASMYDNSCSSGTSLRIRSRRRSVSLGSSLRIVAMMPTSSRRWRWYSSNRRCLATFRRWSAVSS